MIKTLSTCIFLFVFLYSSVVSAAVPLPLKLRFQALYDEQAQYKRGIRMEVYQQNIPQAKEWYLKAIQQKHPDAANRMADLLAKEGNIIEAIAYHKKAVEWGTWDMTRRGFAPTGGPINVSQITAYDEIMIFQLSSPLEASVLALAELHRIYDDSSGLSMVYEERIKQSDFWYDRAYRLKVPAFLIGASLAHLGDPEEALKWFERSLKHDVEVLHWFDIKLKPEDYIPFLHYKMGRSYKALKEYAQAITFYKQAMEFKFQTEKDFQIAAQAALEIARTYKDIPETEAPPQDLIKEAYERAYQIAQEGIKKITQQRLDEKGLGVSLRNLREVKTNIAQRIGVAQHIADDYHKAYVQHERTEDLEEARRWYRAAFFDGEINAEKHTQMTVNLPSPKPNPTVKSQSPLESCEEVWSKV